MRLRAISGATFKDMQRVFIHLAHFVGKLSLDKKDILTKQQYEEYINEKEKEIKTFGYSLFNEE